MNGATMPNLLKRPGPVARNVWSVVALPLVSIALAFLVGAVIIYGSLLITGQAVEIGLPLKAYAALFEGALGSFNGIVNTMTSTVPLIFGGLSVALAFKAGLFNIGAQGQFLLGALGAVAAGVALRDGSPLVAVPVALAVGMLAGAAWGFVPGALKALSGAHEVVTTIMLNYVALGVVAAVVSGPLDLKSSPNPITNDVGNAALPILVGRNGHAGIVLALIAVATVSWLLSRTTRGFEIRTVGANPDAARYAGMRPRFLMMLTMSLAGALAGLAGAVVVLGVTRNMTASFGTTVGFDSIAVALLARSSPVGVVFAALLFGAMRAGAPLMQIEAGIPPELVDVVQGTILLFLAASPVIRRVLRLRNVRGELGTTDTIAKTYSGEATVR